MFMTPQEILTQYQATDGDRARVPVMDRGPSGDSLPIPTGLTRLETHPEMAQRKLQEARAEGLSTSVAKHGVNTPVLLQAGTKSWDIGSQGRYQIMDGNHRVAAANDVSPNSLVPVDHHESVEDARSAALHRYANNPVEKPTPQTPQASAPKHGAFALLDALRGG